jgi:hypothetical protein
MLRNVPFPLKLYAALAFLAAIAALWGIVDLLTHEGSVGSVLWQVFWAAFGIALGIGILQFQPAARLAAMICCWLVFVLFAIVLVFWCIWPHSQSATTVVVIGPAAALNLYFYIVFRRHDIRAMFHLASSRAL